MTNKIRTSRSVAKKASKKLRNKKTSKIVKSISASALSNRRKSYEEEFMTIKFNIRTLFSHKPDYTYLNY